MSVSRNRTLFWVIRITVGFSLLFAAVGKAVELPGSATT